MSETRVGHWTHDDCDVYVGRGASARNILDTPIGKRGWLGNPYSLDEHDRTESIDKFRKVFRHRIRDDAEFRRAVANLHGQTLGCWCQRLDDDAPDCHAEVIAEFADQLAEEVDADE